MKIDRSLNLVIPVEREDGSTLHVFSSPIGQEVFEKYFLVISKTFARLTAEGLGFISGPRIASMMLKSVAMDTLRDRGVNWWDGEDGVEAGLVSEMRRRTNVLILGENGWQPAPYEDVKRRGLLSEDEVSEVEGAVAFFIVNFAMHKRSVAEAILSAAAGMWGLLITSSSLSEYRISLTTSTREEATGAKDTAPSIPV